MNFLNTIITKVMQLPDATAVEVLASQTTSAQSYTYREILSAATSLSHELHLMQTNQTHPLRVGLVMSNSPEWVVADLAIMLSGMTEVPIPLAFSAAQAANLLANTDICIVDAAGASKLTSWSTLDNADSFCKVIQIHLPTLLTTAGSLTNYQDLTLTAQQDYICKIIHTSGTTGNPKGVRIRANGLDEMVTALQRKFIPGTYTRYLSILPLSVLIEQVTAIYMTMMDGGTLVFLPLDVPPLGTAGVTPKVLLPYLRQAAPSAMSNMPPSVVEAIYSYCKAYNHLAKEQLLEQLFGVSKPPFLTCGGASTSPTTLQQLADIGITVYEGYGLSENSSVVAINTPSQIKFGTVGRPLDHVQVKLSEDGELLVSSTSLFGGYTTTDPSSCYFDSEGWLKTGDIADIDVEGFIRIYGRKKNIIVTANGQNISLEWVESKYKTLDFVEEVVIFGDKLEKIHGFFVVDQNLDVSTAKSMIESFGKQHLSEIEQVRRIFIASSNKEIYRNYFTVTGRPMRDKIWTLIINQEEKLWQGQSLSTPVQSRFLNMVREMVSYALGKVIQH